MISSSSKALTLYIGAVSRAPIRVRGMLVDFDRFSNISQDLIRLFFNFIKQISSGIEDRDDFVE